MLRQQRLRASGAAVALVLQLVVLTDQVNAACTPDNAAYFNGLGRCKIASAGLGLGDQWTIELWTQRDIAGPSGWGGSSPVERSLFSKPFDMVAGTPVDPFCELCIERNGNSDNLRVRVHDNTDLGVDDVYVDYTGVGSLGSVWTHLAWAYNGLGNVCAYKNGAQISCQAATTSDHNGHPLFIGASGESASAQADTGYAGFIDEVRVWNTQRSSGEISSNYNVKLVGNEAGLVAYYSFDEAPASQDTAVNKVSGGPNAVCTSVTRAVSNSPTNTVEQCNGNGLCLAQDTCQCFEQFSGAECDVFTKAGGGGPPPEESAGGIWVDVAATGIGIGLLAAGVCVAYRAKKGEIHAHSRGKSSSGTGGSKRSVSDAGAGDDTSSKAGLKSSAPAGRGGGRSGGNRSAGRSGKSSAKQRSGKVNDHEAAKSSQFRQFRDRQDAVRTGSGAGEATGPDVKGLFAGTGAGRAGSGRRTRDRSQGSGGSGAGAGAGGRKGGRRKLSATDEARFHTQLYHLSSLLLEPSWAMVSVLLDLDRAGCLDADLVALSLAKLAYAAGAQDDLIAWLVKRELASATTSSQVFDPDFVPGKLLLAFIKMIGAPYISWSLHKRITQIVSRPSNVLKAIEVDPAIAGSNMPMAKHQRYLEVVTGKVLFEVLSTAKEAPPSLSRCLARVSDEIVQRYPKILREKLGELVFDGLLCTALADPVPAGLTATPPTQLGTRVLRLIAIMLQAASTDKPQELFKDTYLAPMIPAVRGMMLPITKYYKRLMRGGKPSRKLPYKPLRLRAVDLVDATAQLTEVLIENKKRILATHLIVDAGDKTAAASRAGLRYNTDAVSNSTKAKYRDLVASKAIPEAVDADLDRDGALAMVVRMFRFHGGAPVGATGQRERPRSTGARSAGQKDSIGSRGPGNSGGQRSGSGAARRKHHRRTGSGNSAASRASRTSMTSGGSRGSGNGADKRRSMISRMSERQLDAGAKDGADSGGDGSNHVTFDFSSGGFVLGGNEEADPRFEYKDVEAELWAIQDSAVEDVQPMLNWDLSTLRDMRESKAQYSSQGSTMTSTFKTEVSELGVRWASNVRSINREDVGGNGETSFR